MEKTKVITSNSLKGGTGKSSITIMMAKCLEAHGKKVLGIDMDPNNSFSFYCLQDGNEAEQKNIAYALQSENILDFVIPITDSIDLIPSSLRLIDLRAMSTGILKNLLKPADGKYDLVLIDTAPTYDNITLNAINASDLIITPTNFSQFDFNTSIFLSQKLRLETEKYPNWHILFNGHERRYDSEGSLQNQYKQLFIQTPSLAEKILPIEIPFTREVRKFVDTDEKISKYGNTARLHKAICDLCTLITGEEIRPERF